MKNKKEISEERIRLLETAVGNISDRFVREAHEAHEAHSPEKKTRTKILTAPAWLRPVAACLAVLILGGLVVFSIPVVNNIISRRGPAELPGTDVAEADTTEETKTETEESECAIGDKKISPKVQFKGRCLYPAVSINQLLDKSINERLMREEDVEKITLGVTTFADLEEMGIYVGRSTSWDATVAVNNGKMLHIERQYSYEDLLEMFKDQLEWVEDAEGIMKPKVWPVEVKEAAEKVMEENPIVKLTYYEDPEAWEVFVTYNIVTPCRILNEYRQNAGKTPLTEEELLKVILEDDIFARIKEQRDEVNKQKKEN